MDDKAEVPAWSGARRARERIARIFTPRRQVPPSSDRKGDAAKAHEPERKAQVPTSRKTVECPTCGSAAIIRDKGASVVGIGFCGHEYIFKVVKIHCATGHKIDALDEAGSVHDPSVICERGMVGETS